MPLVSMIEFFAFILVSIILAPFALVIVGTVILAIGLFATLVSGIFAAISGD